MGTDRQSVLSRPGHAAVALHPRTPLTQRRPINGVCLGAALSLKHLPYPDAKTPWFSKAKKAMQDRKSALYLLNLITDLLLSDAERRDTDLGAGIEGENAGALAIFQKNTVGGEKRT